MKKTTGFDYLKEIENRVNLNNPVLFKELSDIDGSFVYSWDYYYDIKPPKIKNPRILLSFERGGMENSYINIYLSDYDRRSDDPENKSIYIGFYYIKDYYNEMKKLFDFMYEIQKVCLDIANDLYNGIL